MLKYIFIVVILLGVIYYCIKNYPIQNEKLKTSQEWYILDSSADIVDPDGWRDLPIDTQSAYWFNQKIPEQEYVNRKNLCTIMPFNKNKHRPPYIMD